MSAKTGIEWADATWSPLRVQVRPDAAQIAQAKGYASLIQIAGKMAGHVGPHCEHVSTGCLNCYSGTNNGRCLPANGTGLPFDRRSRDLVEPFVDEKALVQPLRWRAPKRIFVENQSDLFGEWVSDEDIASVIGFAAICHWHTFQILTKRPERMLALFSSEDFRELVAVFIEEIVMDIVDPLNRRTDDLRATTPEVCDEDWPLPNVWLGVSVENQETADARIPLLLKTPAALRFASYEPALGPVNPDSFAGLDWVIFGGESGPGARPTNIRNALRLVRDRQDVAAAVTWKLFMKQLGARPWDSNGAAVDHLFEPCGHECECCTECPSKRDRFDHPQLLRLKDRKGGDMAEWPEWARVREFPSNTSDTWKRWQ